MGSEANGLIGLATAILSLIGMVFVAIWGKRASADKRIETDSERLNDAYDRITKIETERDSWREKYFGLIEENVRLKADNTQLITVRDKADRDRSDWEIKEAQYRDRETVLQARIRDKDNQIDDLLREARGLPPRATPTDTGSNNKST